MKRIRFPDLHRLKSPGQGAVPTDIFLVFLGRGRSHQLQLSPRQCRLEHIGGIDGALCSAGAGNGMQFIDKQHHIPGIADLLQGCPHPFLELSPILGAGHHARYIQGNQPFTAECRRYFAGSHTHSKLLDDGRFSHTGGAQQHRIALLPSGKNADHPLCFSLTPHDRIIRPCCSGGGHILSKLHHQLQFVAARTLLSAILPPGKPLAQFFDIRAASRQQTKSARLLQTDHRQQQMLCGDGFRQCRIGDHCGLFDDGRALLAEHHRANTAPGRSLIQMGQQLPIINSLFQQQSARGGIFAVQTQ